jgi:hypothetical protein
MTCHRRGKNIIFGKAGEINIIFDQNIDPCRGVYYVEKLLAGGQCVEIYGGMGVLLKQLR